MTTIANYVAAGLATLPALPREKRPAISWKCYQDRLPTPAEVAAWGEPQGVCVICGKVSGNVELIDFDHGAEFFGPWSELVGAELLGKLVLERSQSGGMHAVYRLESEIPGNQKLARKTDGRTMIETRGEGGLFLCAPTPGYDLTQGDLTALPCLSTSERERLSCHRGVWFVSAVTPLVKQVLYDLDIQTNDYEQSFYQDELYILTPASKTNDHVLVDVIESNYVTSVSIASEIGSTANTTEYTISYETADGEVRRAVAWDATFCRLQESHG